MLQVNDMDICSLAYNFDLLHGSRRCEIFGIPKVELEQVFHHLGIQIPKGKGYGSFGAALVSFVVEKCPESCIFA